MRNSTTMDDNLVVGENAWGMGILYRFTQEASERHAVKEGRKKGDLNKKYKRKNKEDKLWKKKKNK